MIQPALQFVALALNQFVKNKFGLNEDTVVLNHIVESDESEPLENKNKIVITLINIDYQTLKPFNANNKRLGDGNYTAITPAQSFNLDLLVSSNFDDYSESLKFLGESMLFFQLNPVFDSVNFPSIPKEVDKLQLDIEQINYTEMHNLWSAMGAKYRPSIVYKTRMVTIQGEEINQFDPPIIQTKITGQQ